MDDIRKTQRSFARKALAEPEHRFEDLYHLICREDWIEVALRAVLDNQGSRTSGIDGINKKDLASEASRRRFIQELRADLKAGTYKPMPARRHWIPKPDGRQRPLGILTIRDRVVQMLLKMLMEPIWESDFLDCSHGFRPGRRTMDCIADCYRRIQPRNRFFWVIEGDIKGCFDHINHAILLEMVKRRVRDRRIIALIDSFLKAGVMEGDLFKKTEEGTPQGGVISPLLANIYIHKLDLWWWNAYGSLSPYEKSKRRNAGVGNCILIRYADDFLLLTNGPKAEAYRLREEVQQFLWDDLHLELSLEKTHITHVTDGFDFLGFHIQWMLPKNNKPWLRVTPSKRNVQRLRHTLKTMTTERATLDDPLYKLRAINRVTRGWINYYRYVSVKDTAHKLDWWVNDRFLRWLRKKHKVGVRRVLKRYRHRETQNGRNRYNLAVKNDQGELEFLFHMSDVRLRRYRNRRRENPYLKADEAIPDTVAEPPVLTDVWSGAMNQYTAEWDQARRQVRKRDRGRCQVCGGQQNPQIHHIKARKDKGDHSQDNLVTLCADCHSKTPSYGKKRCRTE